MRPLTFASALFITADAGYADDHESEFHATYKGIF
jgi:hypothetical protein